MKLFGTSGIRMKNLSPEIAYNVGFAIAKDYKNVVIGRDSRTTGELIESAIITGLLNGGATVSKLGIVPTPVLGFASKNYEMGIMITASHNPPEYNGIKLFNKDGTAFLEEQEHHIESIIENKDYERTNWSTIGKVVEDKYSIIEYCKFIINNLKPLTYKHNVLVDCSNAAACELSPYLFTEMGCKVISINSHFDGRFVGRMPEPNEKNLIETMDMIKGLNSVPNKDYIAIAHDGDADRMIAIDEKGRITDFDKLLTAYSRFIVETTDTNSIITTIDASIALDEYVNANSKGKSIKIMRTKVGDVAVSNKIKELAKNGEDVQFGGEPSGTWIHSGIHMTPDGILSGLRLLEMMEHFNKKLCDIMDEIPAYDNMREKISCSDDKKSEVMQKVAKEGEKLFNCVPNTLDGARFDLEDKDAWVLIRPSGTEPYIRIRVEAKDEKVAKELFNQSKELLDNFLN
ncbi:phosphoglucosamine mutase [Methanococcus voltae]|uniref:Phosphoglucosamine mutase n=1 Tax=Methanococcus voltae (strain ATCC BAA-1334 / A3) TaxID=456320 RepID=D7DSE2_METV3|nr:phosphoglucosamine mutase [Methanococcus voltae]MCS3901578.1 phosphoglucosamine mutase [Methanococcus voltae]